MASSEHLKVLQKALTLSPVLKMSPVLRELGPKSAPRGKIIMKKKLLEKMSHALCCLQPLILCHSKLSWVSYHVLNALAKLWRNYCCRGWVVLLDPRILLGSTELHYWMIADKSVTIFTKSMCMLLDVSVEMQTFVMHGLLAPKEPCMK
uniref:Uncharacterized protein n=1 Tax=Arundo donax TaxID=35708 RepID=A0A0A8XQT8_ARUDO